MQVVAQNACKTIRKEKVNPNIWDTEEQDLSSFEEKDVLENYSS